MAFIKSTPKTENINIKLTKDDIETILTILGETTIKIKDIQKIYQILLKLQELHTQL